MGIIANHLRRYYDLNNEMLNAVENFIWCIHEEAKAQADQDAPYELHFKQSAGEVVQETGHLLSKIRKFTTEDNKNEKILL